VPGSVSIQSPRYLARGRELTLQHGIFMRTKLLDCLVVAHVGGVVHGVWLRRVQLFSAVVLENRESGDRSLKETHLVATSASARVGARDGVRWIRDGPNAGSSEIALSQGGQTR
jgi:hypothetical protein